METKSNIQIIPKESFSRLAQFVISNNQRVACRAVGGRLKTRERFLKADRTLGGWIFQANESAVAFA